LLLSYIIIKEKHLTFNVRIDILAISPWLGRYYGKTR